jgi:hypothetical protein
LAQGIRPLGNNHYQVRLFGFDGLPVYQSVYFDGTWTNNDPQPARDAQGHILPEFWAILYQRAFMQQMGVDWHVADGSKWKSRSNMPWQEPWAALVTLTGKETRWVGVALTTPQALRQALQRRDMMVALSRPSGVSKGVVAWHSYTVLDVFQGNGGWQVRLRNPWGTLDDATRTGAALDGRPDGIVTLSWQQFVSSFLGCALA